MEVNSWPCAMVNKYHALHETREYCHVNAKRKCRLEIEMGLFCFYLKIENGIKIKNKAKY